jgi:hypothetical protein
MRPDGRKAGQAENKEDHARQISGNYGKSSHNRALFLDWRPLYDLNHIDVKIIDSVYF